MAEEVGDIDTVESISKFLGRKTYNRGGGDDETFSSSFFPKPAQFQRIPLSELTTREMKTILTKKSGDDNSTIISPSPSSSSTTTASNTAATGGGVGYYFEQRDLFAQPSPPPFSSNNSNPPSFPPPPSSPAIRRMKKSIYDAKREIVTISFSDVDWIVCGDPDDEEIDKLKKRRALKSMLKVSLKEDVAFATGLAKASATQRILTSAVKLNKERIVLRFLNKEKIARKSKGGVVPNQPFSNPPLLRKLLLNTVLTISSQKVLGCNPFVVCPSTKSPISVDYPRVVKYFCRGLKDPFMKFKRHTEPTKNINDMKIVTESIKNHFWN